MQEFGGQRAHRHYPFANWPADQVGDNVLQFNALALLLFSFLDWRVRCLQASQQQSVPGHYPGAIGPNEQFAIVVRFDPILWFRFVVKLTHRHLMCFAGFSAPIVLRAPSHRKLACYPVCRQCE